MYDKNKNKQMQQKVNGQIGKVKSMMESFEKYDSTVSTISTKSSKNKNDGAPIPPNAKQYPLFGSSKQYLEDVKKKLETGSDAEAKVALHVGTAIRSYSRPLKMYRTVEDMKLGNLVSYHELEKYNRNPVQNIVRQLSLLNCHDGQRKLVMGMLDFLSTAMHALKCDQNDVFVVYAGSSGLASAVAAAVFPNIQIILYDPADNTLEFMPKQYKNISNIYRKSSTLPLNDGYTFSQLTVFTKQAGYFTDETAKYIKETMFPFSKRKHLLFVSDIRSEETSEVHIARDMVNQMRWTMMLQASAYMHKFRSPYIDAANKTEIMSIYENIEHLPKEAYSVSKVTTDTNDSDNSFMYLKGKLHVQLYGGQRTMELRLVGAPHPTTHKFVLKRYNINKIEDTMAIFNAVYRNHCNYRSHNNELVSNYEKVAEEYIISQCTAIVHRVDVPASSQVENTQRLCNSLISTIKEYKSDYNTCKLNNASMELKKYGLSIDSLRSILPHMFAH